MCCTILLEVGRRGLVGGQEDLIIDIALDLLADSSGTAAGGMPPQGLSIS